MQTLPCWVRQWNEDLDRARALLRSRADLRALAKKYGAVRLFDEQAAQQILEALRAPKQEAVSCG